MKTEAERFETSARIQRIDDSILKLGQTFEKNPKGITHELEKTL